MQSMSTSNGSTLLRDAALALSSTVEREQIQDISDRDLQLLFASVVRAYAAKHDNNPDLLPFRQSDNVTATDVAVSATGMLNASEIAVFELGMWQTIKGHG